MRSTHPFFAGPGLVSRISERYIKRIFSPIRRLTDYAAAHFDAVGMGSKSGFYQTTTERSEKYQKTHPRSFRFGERVGKTLRRLIENAD